MYNVSLYANETTGSVGERRLGNGKNETTGSVGFRGKTNETTGSVGERKDKKGESTGSVGARIGSSKNETTGSVGFRGKCSELPTLLSSPNKDTLCFHGRDDYKQDSSSVIGKAFGIAGAAAAAIVAAGYAHKVDAVGKLGEGKFKDFMRKTDSVTEPCHRWCHNVKEFCTKHYNEIKTKFDKK